MKRIAITVALLLASIGYCQSISLALGYTGMSLPDQISQFNSMKKYMTWYGIKMPDQKNFPANFCFTGVFDIVNRPKYSLSMEVSHLRTNAYSYYGDATGSIDLKATYYTTLLGIRADRVYYHGSDAKYSFGLSAGIGWFVYRVEEKCGAGTYPLPNSYSSASDKGRMIYCELHFRLEKQIIGPLWGGMEVGGRLGARLTVDLNNDLYGRVSEAASGNKYNISGFRIALLGKYYLDM